MRLTWDQVGQRVYETGVDHGVLYLPNNVGVYDTGVAWNGLTAVNETPSGAESNPQYADNIKYVNLVSAEEFSCTIEAFTYPPEFEQCNGTATPSPGLSLGQQTRKPFGFSYRTLVGNDLEQLDHGYKLHLVYGAQAAPSEKNYGTVNDQPEAMGLSWEVTTTPIDVPGYKPSATFVVDSRFVDAAALAALEDVLYGTSGVDPRLPTPTEVMALFEGTIVEVAPSVPTYNSTTKVITIPSTTGVIYSIDGVAFPAGDTDPITEDTVVTATPAPGYSFPPVTDNDWLFEF